MNIIKSRKYFYIISGLIVAVSLVSLAVRGINFGVDFTGDAVLDVEFTELNQSPQLVETAVRDGGFDVVSIDGIGEKSFRIRTKFLTEADHNKLLGILGKFGGFDEKSFISTGPSVSSQLRRNAVLAVSISLLAIVLYITWAFRKVSKPVSSWVYGIIAIVTLMHDVIIPTGVFSILQIQVDSLFITAILTVLGFSVHDTIVVFDRIRENLRKAHGDDFENIVENSVQSTIARSLNTSITTLFALVAILMFGGDSTRYLVLALIVGIIVGTYSSIFIASSLLVSFEKWRRKRRS